MEETKHIKRDVPKQKLELNNVDINELIKCKLNVKDEELEIVEGGEEESKNITNTILYEQSNMDVDNMSYDDMKQMLKKMLKN